MEDLTLAGQSFRFVSTISPLREADGSVRELSPQSRYENRGRLPLHHYGQGPFCEFGVPKKWQGSGVYALTSNREVVYVGKCRHLAKRFNQGYGRIQPRNCFKGGQQTNCRINRLILDAVKRGQEILLWFLRTEDTQRTEESMQRALQPRWNRGGSRAS